MVKSQPVLRYILRLAPAIAAAVLLSACTTAPSDRYAQTDTHVVNNKDNLLLQASQDEFEEMVRTLDVKSKIMDQYASWKGVRYHWAATASAVSTALHLFSVLSANSLAWSYRAQPRSRRIPATLSNALSCVSAIWFCSAPAPRVATSVSIWATTSLFTPPPAAVS